MKQTARFWHFHRDGWVKLTIRGERELRFGYSSPTDEGWSSYGELLWIEAGAVLCEMVSDGRDCDGRLTQTQIVRCPIEKLASRKCDLDDAPGLLPEWEKVSSRQRDEYAESMGY